MNNDNTGGPAFPTPRYERGDMYSLGMTLRDYFAAKAMQSFIIAACTNENAVLTVLNKAKTEIENEDWIAYSAYEAADAMLREREAT
jgi:hypothetical protein